MTTTYLFGAGASRDAGIPTTIELSKKIYDSFPRRSSEKRALDVVLGGLKHRQAVVMGAAFQEVDIEDLYAALLRLAQRRSDPLAPFVGLWSEAVATAETPDFKGDADQVAKALLGSLLEARFRTGSGVPNVSSFASALEEALRGSQSGLYAKTGIQVLLRILDVCRLDDAKKAEHVRTWLSSRQQETTWIASLNYDNCVELAAKSAGILVDLGLTPEGHVRPAPAGSPGKVTLAKLHGSIDWEVLRNGKIREGRWLGHTGFEKIEPGILLGSGTKLKIRGPYLDLLLSFRERLERTDVLHVCGYSFRDDHINHLLERWWGPGKHVAIHDPGDLSAIAGAIFPRDPTAYDNRPSERVTFDRQTAAEWMTG